MERIKLFGLGSDDGNLVSFKLSQQARNFLANRMPFNENSA